MSAWEWTDRETGDPVGVAVGKIPGRKSIALYSWRGSLCTPLAYFRSEEDAARADALLRTLAEGRPA